MNKQLKEKIEIFRNLILKGYKEILEPNEPSSLYEPIKYFLYPTGKLLRPILFLACIEACGGKPKDYFNQAVAIEFLHNFTLMHDDIMDNAEIRHNRLTLHKKYDVSTAILCGDNLLALSYKKLITNLSSKDFEVIRYFTQGIITVCEGQSLDKDYENEKNITMPEYFKMIEMKTASLIAMSCQLGAICSNVERKMEMDFLSFGKNLGMAFQIQDDLLDICGEEEKFGKKIGADILEGKKTFILIKAFEIIKGKDLTNLKSLVSNRKVNEANLSEVIEIYKKHGIIELTKIEIDKYISKATARLNSISKNHDVLFLQELTTYLLNRTH